ncbi:MAG TPA: hypothetical protein PKD98_01785 [Anaerolineae bacterium]|nr:hypothetical protein [Anaerolineae bacterium]
MGFLDSLKTLFSAEPPPDRDFRLTVRCRRCGEEISTRLDLRHNLSERDEGGYLVHKTLVGGNNLCFQRIDVTLYFDEHKNLVDREISGGEFVEKAEPEDQP